MFRANMGLMILERVCGTTSYPRQDTEFNNKF